MRVDDGFNQQEGEHNEQDEDGKENVHVILLALGLVAAVVQTAHDVGIGHLLDEAAVQIIVDGEYLNTLATLFLPWADCR